MICQEYDNLTSVEKLIMVGKIVHGLQSDSTIFKFTQDLIKMSEMRGLFDGVTINPEQLEEDK